MKITRQLSFFLLIFLLFSCKAKQEKTEAAPVAEEVQTPVTVTHISTEPLAEYLELNAMSSFLQSSFIKATANGFIKSSYVKPGQFVHAGQLAFLMQTKEAKALGNTINNLDPSFRFSGLIKINATQTGYITTIDHQPGDYVQDGEQLAVLSDSKSFGFLLNLPYELRQYLLNNKTVDLELPDKIHLKGTVDHVMPTVDSVSQTQSVLIKVNSSSSIPQNLIAKVRIVKNERTNVASLPKQAILTNEAQTEFWIMKMLDATTAVKVMVTKGLETKDRVEITKPALTANDQIVLTGNYGLPDTAKVKIEKPQ